MARVAALLLRVKKWMPGTPRSRRSRHWRVAHSTPTSRVSASSCSTPESFARSSPGILAPESEVMRRMLAAFRMGMIPGMIGTAMPRARARSTNRK